MASINNNLACFCWPILLDVFIFSSRTYTFVFHNRYSFSGVEIYFLAQTFVFRCPIMQTNILHQASRQHWLLSCFSPIWWVGFRVRVKVGRDGLCDLECPQEEKSTSTISTNQSHYSISWPYWSTEGSTQQLQVK